MPADPQAPAVSAPVQPVEAWAAVSPSGVLCPHMMQYVEPRSARGLVLTSSEAAAGWHLVRVRIVPVEDDDG